MEVNPLQNSLYFNSRKEVWLRMCLKKWIYISSFILYLTKVMIKHHYAIIHKTDKKNEFLNIILQNIFIRAQCTSWSLYLTSAVRSGREAHSQNCMKISCVFPGLITWYWKFSHWSICHIILVDFSPFSVANWSYPSRSSCFDSFAVLYHHFHSYCESIRSS